MNITNVLNYDEYRADGGNLCYPAYIQCLVDSENITQEVGDMLIDIHHKMKHGRVEIRR